jgi:hypothetical protein
MKYIPRGLLFAKLNALADDADARPGAAVDASMR